MNRTTKAKIARARRQRTNQFLDLYSFKLTKPYRSGTRSALLAQPIVIFWDAGLGKSKTTAPPMQMESYKQALGRISRNNLTAKIPQHPA